MTTERVRGAIAGAIAGAMAIGAGACGASVDPPPPAGGRQTVVELAATPNRDLDLLVVFDDSTGLIEIQQSFATSLPLLVERLKRVPGGLPNLHVGVVTTDMGTQASGNPTPAPPIGQLGNGGCASVGKNGVLQTQLATSLTDRFLSDVAGPGGARITNYTGDLVSTISLMTRGGAGGCGFEQPLAAMRAALRGQPMNAGFLREQALLGVLFVTDEDDCSAASPTLFDPNAVATLGSLASFRCTRFGVACEIGGATPDDMNQPGMKETCGSSASSTMVESVSGFADFLRGLKADPRQLMVAGIMGPAAPLAVELRQPAGGGGPVPALAHVCSYTGQFGLSVADPAPRVQAFLNAFPDRSRATSVCNSDLSGALSRVGDLLARGLGSPCVDGALADAKPDQEGEQLDCVVEDVVGAGVTTIRPCDAAERAPCWKLEADPDVCLAPGNRKLVVVRSADPAPETVTRMRCAVAE